MRVTSHPNPADVRALIVAAAVVLTVGCGGQPSPASSTTDATATVRFVYRASTAPRTDLSAAAEACVRGVGRTHIHPSWRSFGRVDMMPAAAGRWGIAF